MVGVVHVGMDSRRSWNCATREFPVNDSPWSSAMLCVVSIPPEFQLIQWHLFEAHVTFIEGNCHFRKPRSLQYACILCDRATQSGLDYAIRYSEHPFVCCSLHLTWKWIEFLFCCAICFRGKRWWFSWKSDSNFEPSVHRLAHEFYIFQMAIAIMQ